MIGCVNSGEERLLSMSTNPSSEGHSLRFQTRSGQLLIDRITYIEALATERFRAGVSYESIRSGALTLLKAALQDTLVELAESPAQPKQIQACTPLPKPPRRSKPKR